MQGLGCVCCTELSVHFTMRSVVFLHEELGLLCHSDAELFQRDSSSSLPLQLAGKGCVEGKGAVLLGLCLVRCAAAATSPSEKQGGCDRQATGELGCTQLPHQRMSCTL